MSATAEGRPGFLADVIVELGLAEQAKVDAANAQARSEGRTLAEVLVESGTLGEHDLARAVAERYGLPMVDLDSFPVDPEAAEMVGKAAARRYGVAPAGFASDGALLLAMADPSDSLARNDVAVSTRLEVRPVIAPRGQIASLIESLPERGVTRSRGSADTGSAPVSGSLLWQADKSASPDPATRDPDARPDPIEPFALQAADRYARDHPHGERIRGATGDKDARIARLCEQLSKRDSQLARLRDEVAQLEEAVANRDADIEKLKASAGHRDRALAQLGQELAASASEGRAPRMPG